MHGPIGANVSKPLRARVLPVLLLQLARGDVVDARQAEDVLVGASPRCTLTRRLADDDAELGLVIDAPGPHRHLESARPGRSRPSTA